MRTLASLFLVFILPLTVCSQTFQNPNIGLSSHSTAKISKVVFGADVTEVYLTVANEVEGGWICFDKKTRLIKPDGSSVRIKDVDGVPFCPDHYNFSSSDQVVSFRLVFPATGEISWFNIIENCNSNCFSFYGITTDQKLNEALDEAFAALYLRDNDEEACVKFVEIIEKFGALNPGIKGAVYLNIIVLYNRLGMKENVRLWYNELLKSKSPDLSLYIENLKSQGISF
jgi:hypothetical protein